MNFLTLCILYMQYVFILWLYTWLLPYFLFLNEDFKVKILIKGDTSGKDQQQSLGVYTPDSSTNSVHSLHSYNPGQAGTGTPTAGDTGDYHTVQASVAAVSKPGSSVGKLFTWINHIYSSFMCTWF